MIKKALVVFLICFLIGNSYLLVLKPSRLQPQHQYHENLCKAEQFVLNNKNVNVVILGSSLGNRINRDLLPSNWFKLTFSGMSSLEGLEVVNRSNKNTKYVFLEINVLSRPQNEAFLKDVFPPVISDLKEPLPALQIKNQPVSLVYPLLAYLCYGTQKRISALFKKEEQTPKEKVDTKAQIAIGIKTNNVTIIKNIPPIMNPVFQLQYNDYNKLLNKDVVESRLTQIEAYIRQLEEKHIKIIFYEMPVDQQLRHLALSKQIRKSFYNRFPTNQYNYIITPDSIRYQTSDAIHLSGQSINKYSAFFKEQAIKLMSSL